VTRDPATATRRTVRGVHWRKQPCPAELVVGALDHPGSATLLGRTFTCQKQQTWKGPLELPHHHRWDGVIDGQQVTVIWWDRGGS
jgi:hypothetical protein